MQRLEALIFDLEGTLLDSTVDIGDCLNLLLHEEGRPSLSPQQMEDCLTESLMDTCRNAMETTGGNLDEKELYPLVKRLIEHMRSHKPSDKQIYPNVREMLESYKKRGIKLGICTNKNEDSTKKQLTALNLINFFDFIAGGNTFMVHKPNPDHVTGVLEALDVTANKALFIGDGPTDLIACEAANVPCIIITHNPPTQPKDDKAAALITKFDELDACIEKLGFGV